MKSLSFVRHRDLLAILAVAGACVLGPYALEMAMLPIYRDSGVFLYTAMRMLEGGMPYVDSWDHKGPLIYLFDALGYLMLHGPAGVFALEGLLVFAGLSASMWVWKRWLHLMWVLLIAVVFVASYFSKFEGGNLTETWLVPFLLITYSIALAVFFEEDMCRRASLQDVLCACLGLSIAVAALTRPNNAAGLGVLALHVGFSWGERRWRSALIATTAFAAVAAPVLAWIHLRGATGEFVSQYWAYNRAYSSAGSLADRVQSAYSMVREHMLSPVSVCLLLAIGHQFGAGGFSRMPPRRSAFVGLMTCVFAADFLSQCMSGKPYLHYILVSIPSMTVLLVALAPTAMPTLDGMPWKRQLPLLGLLLPLLAATLLRPAFNLVEVTRSGVRSPLAPQRQLVEYLQAKTTPDDRVLVYGAETWLLAASQRESPTSLTYIYPVLSDHNGAYRKYLRELTAAMPAYIVESAESCGLERVPCAENPQTLPELRAFVEANYRLERELAGYRFWRRVRAKEHGGAGGN